MIRKLDTSEFLSILIIERTVGFKNGFRKLSYDRIFKIANRVTDKFNKNISFDLSTEKIKAFCNFLIDKGKINISYDEIGLTLYQITDEQQKWIKQYAPINDYNTIKQANF